MASMRSVEAASTRRTNVRPSRPIRIAAQLHPQQGDYPALRDAAVRAEELGYDIAYNWDHFFPLYGDRDGPHLECWTVLAAWAEATTTIEIGPLVSCISYRQRRTSSPTWPGPIDRISGGRVILGIGAGWKQRDYEEYGYEFLTMGQRIQAMGEAIPRDPAPPRRPQPAAGPPDAAADRRAPASDGPSASSPSTPTPGTRRSRTGRRSWNRRSPRSAAGATRSGRDPAEIEWGVGVEPEDIERFLARDAAVYVEMGFSQFTLGFNGPSWPVDGGVPFLRWRDEMNARLGVAAEAAV